MMINEEINIDIQLGDGLTFNEDHQITTKWLSPMERDDRGILIPSLKGPKGISGDTVPDGWTVVPTQNSSNGPIKANRDVVEYIFSICAYKVIENTRTSVDTYSVDNTQIKTVQDIINEFNRVMDYAHENNLAKYHCSSYNIQTGNLLQLKDNFKPVQLTNWPVAIDNANRYYSDNCLALFYIKEAQKASERYVYTKKLTLTCLWSNLSDYVKGQDYTANALNDVQ